MARGAGFLGSDAAVESHKDDVLAQDLTQGHASNPKQHRSRVRRTRAERTARKNAWLADLNHRQPLEKPPTEVKKLEDMTPEERGAILEQAIEPIDPKQSCWLCGSQGVCCRGCAARGTAASFPGNVYNQIKLAEDGRCIGCGVMCPCPGCNPCRFRDWLDDGRPVIHSERSCVNRYNVRTGLLAWWCAVEKKSNKRNRKQNRKRGIAAATT